VNSLKSLRIKFSVIILLGFVVKAESQTIVKMEQVDGGFVVPCKLNESESRFGIDTVNGCASISLTEAREMLKNGYLTKGDFVSSFNADTIAIGSEINLSIIEIGNHFIYNTPAIVTDSQIAPVYLGKKVLEKLGNVEIDTTGSLIITEKPLYSNVYKVNYGCASGNCLNGYGAYIYPGGAVYVGNFIGGDLVGYGAYLYEDGAKYYGFFQYGEYEGKGVLIQPDGSTYVGDFKSGEFNGFGRMNFSSGKKYTGEFVDGVFNGYGVYTFTNGQKYSGNFVDGEYNGNGTMVFSNGARYVGEFKGNKRNGSGTYTLSNGLKYVGGFRDGVFSGKGILTKPDGTIQSGNFENGVFLGE